MATWMPMVLAGWWTSGWGNGAATKIKAGALGRKNYLFAGSDAGGERAAALYGLTGTAELSGLNPETYLRQVSLSASTRSTASTNRCPGTSPGLSRLASHLPKCPRTAYVDTCPDGSHHTLTTF